MNVPVTLPVSMLIDICVGCSEPDFSPSRFFIIFTCLGRSFCISSKVTSPMRRETLYDLCMPLFFWVMSLYFWVIISDICQGKPSMSIKILIIQVHTMLDEYQSFELQFFLETLPNSNLSRASFETGDGMLKRKLDLLCSPTMNAWRSKSFAQTYLRQTPMERRS